MSCDFCRIDKLPVKYCARCDIIVQPKCFAESCPVCVKTAQILVADKDCAVCGTKLKLQR